MRKQGKKISATNKGLNLEESKTIWMFLFELVLREKVS